MLKKGYHRDKENIWSFCCDIIQSIHF